MALNPLIRQIIFQGAGSMDMDSDPRKINHDSEGQPTGEESYIYAKNISKVSLVEQEDGVWYSVNGNVLAFAPPIINPQDKMYAITFDNSTGDTFQVNYTNLNGSPFPIPCTPTFTPTTGNLAADTVSIGNAIAAALTASGYTPNVNSGTPGTVLVQIVSNPLVTGFDYVLLTTAINTIPNTTVTTIEESWDITVGGRCYPTGNKDWLNDLFITSSTVGPDPITFNVVGTQISLGGDVQINVAGNILQYIPFGGFGNSVTVGGVNGTIEANGTWINGAASYNIIHPGQTTLTLYNCPFVNAYISGGTITLNIYGFLNISVNQYNLDSETWTSYNLLQTKEIDSRYNHPYRDVEGDEANEVINLYMTDNNDRMRIFSYTGPYMDNGAIKYWNPQGQYTYEGVEDEMRLIIGNARCIVSNAVVIDSGGQVATGLWRYSAILRYSDLTGTYPSLLSRPAEIFTGSMSNPVSVMGNTAGEPSDKQVQVTISDIPVNTFAYLDLIGVNYVGAAEVGYLIKRVLISPSATSVTVTHTGFETYQNYDTTQLTQQGTSYVKAGSLKIISDTLMAANLTTEQVHDFSAFTKTWLHSVNKVTNVLNPVGDDRNNWATLGDYQDPVAVFNYIGNMDNETYRYGAMFEFNDSTYSNVYWIDDIRMDNYLLGEYLIVNPMSGLFQVGDVLSVSFVDKGTVYNIGSTLTLIGLTGIPVVGEVVNDVAAGVTGTIIKVSGTTIYVANQLPPLPFNFFGPGDAITGSLSGFTATINTVDPNVLSVNTLVNDPFLIGDNIGGSLSGQVGVVSDIVQVAFNRANPEPIQTQFPATGGYRRVSSFNFYDLSLHNGTNPEADNSYVTQVSFSGIDLNYVIDGVAVKDLVKRIHIFRVDNTTYGLNEVIGAGLICRHAYGVTNLNIGVIGQASTPQIAFDNPFLLTGYDGGQGLYQFLSSAPTPTFLLFPAAAPTYSYGEWGNGVGYRDHECSFYCPDSMWGILGIGNSPSDALICYGQPDFEYVFSAQVCADETANNTFSNGNHPASDFWSMFIKLSGDTNQFQEPQHNVITKFAQLTNFSGETDWAPPIGGITKFSSSFYFYEPNPTIKGVYDTPEKYLLALTNPIDNINTQTWYTGQTNGAPYPGARDLGLYYAQYYTDKGSLTAYITQQSKFGDTRTGVYIPTGFFIDIASVPLADIPDVSIAVYGGDTFTQKTYFKKQYPAGWTNTGNNYDAGAGVGVAFFCQNRFNFNMRNQQVPGGMFSFPTGTVLGDWLNDGTPDIDNQIYDSGYTPRNIENQLPAFNPELVTASHQGSLEIFSAVKPQGSLINNFQFFPPLNIHSEQTDKGDITALLLIDGELYVLQPRALWRDFYTDIGTFRGSGTGEVTLGSSLPFSKPAQPLSNNGCSNRFSVIQGKGHEGEDVVCWIDTVNKKVMMLSRNGLVDITGKMRSWFANNLNTDIGDIPILNREFYDVGPPVMFDMANAISGVFDEKRKEFIWTVMMQPNGVEWDNLTSYPSGAIVYYGEASYEGIQTAYRALSPTTIGIEPVSTYSLTYVILTVPFADGDTITDENGSTATIVHDDGISFMTLTNVVFAPTFSSFSGIFTGVPSGGSATANVTTALPPQWEVASDVQSCYTIAYSLYSNRRKGGWSTFYTPRPYFYAQWKDTYLSAFPDLRYNGFYLADAGTPLGGWFYFDLIAQFDTGMLKYITNELPALMKQFTAIQISSLLETFHVDFYTQDMQTAINRGDGSQDYDVWETGIPNDILNANKPPEFTDWINKMVGEYLINNVVFAIGEEQKIANFVNNYIILNTNLLAHG